MGFWKGFRSRRRRRGFRPVRRSRRIKRTIIPRTIQPRTKVIKVHAVDYFNQTHNAGAIATLGTQQNSIDDPFTSNSGQQPCGYDQWKTLYRKAIVLASKVTVEVHNNTSAAVMVGLTPMPVGDGLNFLTTYEHYMEVPRTKHKLLSPDVDRAVLTHQISTKKLHSISNYKDNKQYLEIDLANETPPATPTYWHIWSQPQDQSTTTTGTAVQLTVKMSYIVLLYDPIIPARSVET